MKRGIVVISVLFLLFSLLIVQAQVETSSGGGGGGGVSSGSSSSSSGSSSSSSGGGGGFYTDSSDYCEVDKVSCIITLRPNSEIKEEVGGKTHSFLMESIPVYSNAVILIDGNQISLRSNREAFFDDIKIEDVRVYSPTNPAQSYVEFRIRNFDNSSDEKISTPNSASGGQGGGCYDTDGGKDIYKKGIAYGVNDSCLSKYTLSERYCTEDNVGANSAIDCQVGYLCQDGACIKSSEDDRLQTNSSDGSSSNENTFNKSINENVSCDGCLLNDKCLSVGYRFNETFCDINGDFIPYKETNSQCDNNFECSSNVCVSNSCINPGLLQKIINWFKGIFGD